MPSKRDRSRNMIRRERLRLAPGEAEPLPIKDPLKAPEIFSTVLKKLGLDDCIWFSEIEAEWPKIVGPTISKHAFPGRMNGTNLVIFVDSSVWLSELTRYSKKTITDKLQARFGKAKIGSISIQINPG